MRFRWSVSTPTRARRCCAGGDRRRIWRRLRPIVVRDQRSGLICADALHRLRATEEARQALIAARLLGPDEAKALIDQDYPGLQALWDELGE